MTKSAQSSFQCTASIAQRRDWSISHTNTHSHTRVYIYSSYYFMFSPNGNGPLATLDIIAIYCNGTVIVCLAQRTNVSETYTLFNILTWGSTAQHSHTLALRAQLSPIIRVVLVCKQTIFRVIGGWLKICWLHTKPTYFYTVAIEI